MAVHLPPPWSVSLLLLVGGCRFSIVDQKEDTGETGLPLATWFADVDGDGYGDASSSRDAATAPSGFVADATDCDDADATVHPGADEVCDDVDDDCDGGVDEEALDVSTWYRDLDADGWGDAAVDQPACDQPSGYVPGAGDCDDEDAAVHPEAVETCDGVDDDCDELVDEGVTETWYLDHDGDGHGSPDVRVEACEVPEWFTDTSDDCDDLDPSVHPGADEVCNDTDDDCDGTKDEDALDPTTSWLDMDGDGWGDEDSPRSGCTTLAGYSAASGDCDDRDASVHPEVDEVCNGTDDDCDGSIDDDAVDARTWYLDHDQDGYGTADVTDSGCAAPSTFFVSDDQDCDDLDADIHPATEERCDGLDNDCDGVTDPDTSVDAPTWYVDLDGDGAGDPASPVVSCDPGDAVAGATDCDDTLALVHPGAAETCNERDDDCDGLVDDADSTVVGAPAWYPDVDLDGYGDTSAPQAACLAPWGHVADGTDCEDRRDDVHPGSPEICDGLDDDCDGLVDDEDPGALGADWYLDADGDGWGDPAEHLSACLEPSGYVPNHGDCDDSTTAVSPAEAEDDTTWDDDDCDGTREINLEHADVILAGAHRGDAFGCDLAAAGDLDGDGLGDLAVGARGWGGEAGALYVLLAPFTADAMVEDLPGFLLASGDAGWDQVGDHVAAALDFNGDGLPDPVVGAPNDDGLGVSQNGGVFVLLSPLEDAYSLPGGADVALWGEATSDQVGAVGNAGDVDGDGIDDLLAGAAQADRGGAGSGGAWLVLGSPSPRAERSLADADIRFLPPTGDLLGDAVAGVGDLDGDGLDDVALAAAGAPSLAARGAVYVFTGLDAISGDVAVASRYAARVAGSADDDALGLGLAEHPGDVDGDGYADLVVAAPLADGTAADGGAVDGGAVYLFRGPVTGDLDAASDAFASWIGEEADDALGANALTLADVDGDGRAEIAMGTDQYRAVREPGVVYVVDDPAAGTWSAGEANWRLPGPAGADAAAGVVANAGDLDGDGRDDLAVGASDGTGSAEGAVYLLFGVGFSR